jgi:diguanylate cyclase (GGDEF)-like protein
VRTATSEAVSTGSAQELVPLAERLRWLWLFRVLAVTTVAAFAPSVGDAWAVEGRIVLLATAAYLAVELVMHVLWRLSQQRMLRLFAAVLVVDGAYLAALAWAVQGEGGPLPYLTLVHLIVVALLASYRTGIKLAVWHSALAGAPLYLSPTTAGTFGDLFGRVWLLWLVTLATATFSAINERELRRRRYDLEALAELGTALEAATSPSEVADALLERLADAFGFPRGLVVAGPDLPQALLASVGCAGGDPSYPGGEGVLERTTSGRLTTLVAGLDPDADPWLSALLPGAGNLLVVPLPDDDGALGCVVLEHSLTRGSRVERRVVSMVERFVAHGALSLANAWLVEQIRASAVTDGLTGIANRREFDNWLARSMARAVRAQQPLSLVLVDIDHFKRLNDRYGHQIGDEVLREVAALLAEHARAGDLAARYGGEEFALVLSDCDAQQAGAIAERLRGVVAAAPLPGPVTVTAGVASFPEHAVNGQDLIRAADAALYAGKSGGRDVVVTAPRPLAVQRA